MILPIQILNDLISSTEHKLLISNVITNADGSFTLYVNYTYYLNSQRKVIIDGITYRITDFALNESITITGSIIPTATEFTIEPPEFKHGTPQKVNGEIKNRIKKSYPFIWLLEFLDIDYNDRFEDSTNVTPDLNLFFLTDTYYKNWDIDQHYTEAIHPMLNEIDFFIRTIKKRRDLFGELESHTVTNHVNFGEYITNKGYDQEILSGRLSGCQLKISLPYVVDVCNTMPVVSICNPVSIYENEVFKEYVQAGGSFYYTTGGGDATEIITDSDSNVLYTNVIPSGDTETQIIADSTVTNSNASYNANILAQGSLVLADIDNVDSDGLTVPTPAQTPFVCTTSVASINASQLSKTGANPFTTNDDGNLQFGQGTDFFTLDYNNKFGNTSRFTDDLGTQIYASGVIVDWATFNQINDTVLCYFQTVEPAGKLTDLLNAQPYTKNLLSNWWVCNMAQLLHLFNYGVYRNVLNYAPFNLDTSSTAISLWSSTRDSSTVAYYVSSLGTSLAGHTGARRALLSRTYTLTELGL